MQSEIIWAVMFGSFALLAQFLPYRIGLPLGFGFVVLAVWQLYIGEQVTLEIGSLIIVLAILMTVYSVRHQKRLVGGMHLGSNTGLDLSRKLPQRRLIPKKRLNANDSIWAYEFRETMRIQHGHTDNEGIIEQELLDGYTKAEIGLMPCQRCGRPRNEVGKDII